MAGAEHGDDPPPVWRWRKRVRNDAETLAHWESVIEEGFVPDGTLRRVEGRTMACVEVFSTDAERVEDLRQVFGGGCGQVDAEALMRPSAECGSPLKIRDRLVVTESVETGEIEALQSRYPGRSVLSFPPELAFGTGRHATTGTCLRMLADIAAERSREEVSVPWRMLDVGHGSGILAVAAVALGAECADGFDFDPRAVEAGRRNARRHHVPGSDENCSARCRFSEAEVAAWQPPQSAREGYQVIAANLFAEVLVKHLPGIASWLGAGGDLVLSGILHRQAGQVRDAAEAAGLVLRPPVVRGKWVAMRGCLRD